MPGKHRHIEPATSAPRCRLYTPPSGRDVGGLRHPVDAAEQAGTFVWCQKVCNEHDGESKNIFFNIRISVNLVLFLARMLSF